MCPTLFLYLSPLFIGKTPALVLYGAGLEYKEERTDEWVEKQENKDEEEEEGGDEEDYDNKDKENEDNDKEEEEEKKDTGSESAE